MVRNGQFLRDGKASHSPCIWMSARPIHGVAFLSCWFTLKGVCCCCEEIVWRRRIYRKYAYCKWLKNAGLEFTRADVVLSISRGPPGQWFPEIEYWASAIFVGTSGIPPKIIYRSVKSYNSHPQTDLFRSIWIISVARQYLPEAGIETRLTETPRQSL